MMLNRKCLRIVAACAVAATPFVSSAVSAAGIDGSSNTVCAVTRVVACLEDGQCLQGQPKDFDLPELLVLDAKNKVLRGTHESGHKAVSPIKNMEHNGEHLVLQGVENSRGWDIAINAKTGKMSGAGVGDGISFLAHGTCTAL
jgi:hypothetical protein